MEVKRNFCRHANTHYRCVLEDLENNTKICVDLIDDGNTAEFDIYLMDENENIGNKLSVDDETHKKYADVVSEMWSNDEIGEYAQEI